MAKALIGQKTPVGAYTHEATQTFGRSSLTKVPVTGNFLAHAKIHVFAEKYLIKDLAQMACHLLHRGIVDSSVEMVGSSALVQMIEYAYENSGDSDGSNGVDEIKRLALRHAVVQAEKLFSCKGFCNLLREEGRICCRLR